MTAQQILGVVCAMGVAALVQSISGFGFSLLAVPLMSLAIDVHLAVVVSTIVALGTTFVHAWQERHEANLPTVRRLILASFVGMPFGFVAFLTFSQRSMKLGLGVVIVVITVMLVRGIAVPPESRRHEWALGMVSGALATSLSTNGPPLVFLLQARRLSPEAFRGTISSVFAVVNVATFIVFVSAGRVTVDSVVLGAIVVPGVVVATWIGYRIRPHVDAEKFRWMVLGLLAISGVSAVVTAL